MGVLMRLPAVCVEKVLIVVASGHSAEPTGDNFLSFFLILKKIGPKLWPWKCPNEKVQNIRYDVIDFEMSKSKKNRPRKYLLDHL